MSLPNWRGVFPAVTTQFNEDLSINLAETQRVIDGLIRDGVHGLIIMGTVGENNSLEPEEKRQVLAAAKEVTAGRVPVITGVSELTTPRAVAYAKDAEKIGADGLMLLPAMVYVPTEEELFRHFAAVAGASALPIMLYNNPPAYRVDISVPLLQRLAEIPTIVALKESAPDTRRFTDLANAIDETKMMLMAGLDDVALEGLLLGARGWISGLTNAFPKESVALYDAVVAGDLAKARAIYRWFLPLLHLDARHDLVQSIKLAEQVMGRGSERVRPPRYILEGKTRADVIAMVEKAAATRPVL
ncbi:dihydrodipicolinate synthase family protein [Nitrospirillum amazonense]|uniref:4-hydroxy-tetrahydrodipicolinate synthase n=1 Tax=Nitrospirillum amazonense TaxID=28077 RepID=A0A560JUE4_9PROT|nr:dihydrodipicolinate synthase family protein [Nitrospirillum amazonense]MDG3442389.1 dihydrodipicolinate synthase family protein [Nitrospirillum amazonense]TWB73114.1 4-hydroxy-tetrahydrodipicolinate synthase [Nitrospirillum amazonense]